MKLNQELGAFVRKTSVSKAFLNFSYGILVLFTGLSIFIYFELIIPVNEGSVHFSGDISILYYSIGFIMTLAFLIFIIASYMSKGGTFYLYENGIVIENKVNKETLYFKDIEDVYLFTSGKRIFDINNIAVRKNSTAVWYPISARYSGIYSVIEFIRTKHVSLYVPVLLKKLEEGNSIDFKYVDFKNLAMKQFTAINTNSYLNVKTNTMQIYKDRLVVDSQIIYFKEVLSSSVTDWTSQIQLLNTDGKVVFKKAFTSVFSGDSFVTLLNELVNTDKLRDQ